MFTTKKNIRNFEWTEQEAEDLFESIFEIDDNGGTSKTIALELNAMTIMKSDPTTRGDSTNTNQNSQRKIGKNSGMYDVHDGQQRLVTLSLLLAAIRDELLANYPEHMDSAEEVARMIYPLKPRMDPVCRIELRETSGNKWLHSILSRTHPNGNLDLGTDVDFGETIVPEERSWGRLGVPRCDQQILTVYNYFRKRIRDLNEDEILGLIDHFLEDVYVMLCEASDTIIARNIVMGQGKGKNVEPVDFFKGMVCFNYNEEERVQDATLESWNDLCDDVGRGVLGDACLLLAQRYQKTRVKKNGEISLVEQFLRDRINEYNDAFPNPNIGEFVFKTEIAPAARALHDFRNGNFKVRLGDGTSEPPSLAFLRASAGIATCKELELVVLDLIIRYDANKHDNLKKAISNTLRHVESIALWMMVTKPKPKERFERCLGIIENVDHVSLSQEETRTICDALYHEEFGKPSACKKAAAILERLNEHILVETSKNRLEPMEKGRHIEHVLPQKHQSVEAWNELWSSKDAAKWKHRLGNLALLDGNSNSKIGNRFFDEKKELLRNSPYPLTKDLATTTPSTWDVDAVKFNHEKYIDLAKTVWKLSLPVETMAPTKITPTTTKVATTTATTTTPALPRD